MKVGSMQTICTCNRFYYHHTTRHGGSNRDDPILALFNNMYKRISYAVNKGDGSFTGAKWSKEYAEFVEQNVKVSAFPSGIKVKEDEMYVIGSNSQDKHDQLTSSLFSSYTYILCNYPKY